MYTLQFNKRTKPMSEGIQIYKNGTSLARGKLLLITEVNELHGKNAFDFVRNYKLVQNYLRDESVDLETFRNYVIEALAEFNNKNTRNCHIM